LRLGTIKLCSSPRTTNVASFRPLCVFIFSSIDYLPIACKVVSAAPKIHQRQSGFARALKDTFESSLALALKRHGLIPRATATATKMKKGMSRAMTFDDRGKKSKDDEEAPRAFSLLKKSCLIYQVLAAVIAAVVAAVAVAVSTTAVVKLDRFDCVEFFVNAFS
jgi:hypothetical protein